MSQQNYIYDGGAEPKVVYIPVPVASVCCCSGFPPPPETMTDDSHKMRTPYDDLVDSFVKSNWQALEKSSHKRPQEDKNTYEKQSKRPKLDSEPIVISPETSPIKVCAEKTPAPEKQDVKPTTSVNLKPNTSSWALNYLQKIGQTQHKTIKLNLKPAKSKLLNEENAKVINKELINKKLDTVEQFAPIRPKLKFVIPKLNKPKVETIKETEYDSQQENVQTNSKNTKNKEKIKTSSIPKEKITTQLKNLEKNIPTPQNETKDGDKKQRLVKSHINNITNRNSSTTLSHKISSTVSKIIKKYDLEKETSKSLTKTLERKRDFEQRFKKITSQKEVCVKKQKDLNSNLKDKNKGKDLYSESTSRAIKYETLQKTASAGSTTDKGSHKNLKTPVSTKENILYELTEDEEEKCEYVDLRLKLNQIEKKRLLKNESLINNQNNKPFSKDNICENLIVNVKNDISTPFPENKNNETIKKATEPVFKEIQLVINIIHQQSDHPKSDESETKEDIKDDLDFLDDFNIDEVVNYLNECENKTTMEVEDHINAAKTNAGMNDDNNVEENLASLFEESDTKPATQKKVTNEMEPNVIEIDSSDSREQNSCSPIIVESSEDEESGLEPKLRHGIKLLQSDTINIDEAQLNRNDASQSYLSKNNINITQQYNVSKASFNNDKLDAKENKESEAVVSDTTKLCPDNEKDLASQEVVNKPNSTKSFEQMTPASLENNKLEIELKKEPESVLSDTTNICPDNGKVLADLASHEVANKTNSSTKLVEQMTPESLENNKLEIEVKKESESVISDITKICPDSEKGLADLASHEAVNKTNTTKSGDQITPKSLVNNNSIAVKEESVSDISVTTKICPDIKRSIITFSNIKEKSEEGSAVDLDQKLPADEKNTNTYINKSNSDSNNNNKPKEDLKESPQRKVQIKFTDSDTLNESLTFDDPPLKHESPITKHHDILLAKELQDRMFSYLHDWFDISSVIQMGTFSTIFKCKNSAGKNFAAKIFHYKCNRFMGITQEISIKTYQNDIPKENLNLVFLVNGFGLNRTWVLLMEYYPYNLAQYLTEMDRPFHVDVVKKLARQLVGAVMTLRNNNIVHSDIKPSHILINSSGTELKLCGLDEAYNIKPKFLLPNIGTTNYRAPEIILGYSASFSIDVWSTAVVMYEMITGYQLFPGIYNNDILYKQLATMGNVPIEVLMQSHYADRHFRGSSFLRRFGPKGQSVIVIHRFNKSARIGSTLFQAYARYWSQSAAKIQRDKDADELRTLHKLLEQMLAIDPRHRLSIEFVYSSPFIYESNKCSE